MEKITLKAALTFAALVSALASGTIFAQAGGNGNGGNGGGGSGNAHGAATAGMTYHGDPVTSPLDKMPGKMNTMSNMSHSNNDAMSADGSQPVRAQ